MGFAAVLLPVMAFWAPQWLLPTAFFFLIASELSARGKHPHLLQESPSSKSEGCNAPRKITGIVVVGIGLILLQLSSGSPELIYPRQWIAKLPGMVSQSSRRTPDLSAGIDQVVILVSSLVLLYFLRLRFNEARTKSIWANCTTLVLAALALWLLTTPESVNAAAATRSLGRLHNDNALSALMAFGTVLSAARLIAARTNTVGTNLLCGFALLLCGMANLEIASRGGTAALLGGLISLALLRVTASYGLKFKHTGIVIVVGLSGSLLLAPSIVAEQITAGVGSRLDLWSACIEVWKLAPWGGAGIGCFETQFALHSSLLPPPGATFLHPDSSWVLLLFEFGIAGLLLLFVGIVTVLHPIKFRHDSHLSENEQTWHHAGFSIGIACSIAAIGDPSFHRPQIIVFALPLIAIMFARTAPKDSPPFPWRWVGMTAFFALAFVPSARLAKPQAPAINGYTTTDQKLRLTPQASAAIERHPHAINLHHKLGRDAAILGDYKIASSHWDFAAALQPANTALIGAYAQSVHDADPTLAQSLWQRLLNSAPARRHAIFAQIVRDNPATTSSYWQQVIRAFPDLLITTASNADTTGQRAFEIWLSHPELNRPTSLTHAVQAFALWGSRPQFDRWMQTIPKPSIESARNAATVLHNRNRSDLAWSVIERTVAFPAPLPPTSASAQASKLSSLIDPQNFSALSRIIDQIDQQDPAYFNQLELIASRPDAPPWFALRLAYFFARKSNYTAATHWGIQSLKNQHDLRR